MLALALLLLLLVLAPGATSRSGGAGTSTALSAVEGLVPPVTSSISIDGHGCVGGGAQDQVLFVTAHAGDAIYIGYADGAMGTVSVIYATGTQHGVLTLGTSGASVAQFYLQDLVAPAGLVTVTLWANDTANSYNSVQALSLMSSSGAPVLVDASGSVGQSTKGSSLSAQSATTRPGDMVVGSAWTTTDTASPTFSTGAIPAETLVDTCAIYTAGPYNYGHTIASASPVGGVDTGYTLWLNESSTFGPSPTSALAAMSFYEASAALSASASVSPGTTASTGTLLSFTGGATGGAPPYAWNWAFGDTTTASTQNATHSYATAGSYSTTLTVVDHLGASVTRWINLTITAVPTLTGVTVSPTSDALAVSGSATFTATPTCTGGSCPGGITYAWTRTNTEGSLNAPTLNPVVFTAGTVAGQDTLFVNATAGTTTVQSSAVVITIASSSPPPLASVSVSPTSDTLSTGGSAVFTASATCTGGTCPATPSYSWSMTNNLGTLTIVSASSVTFTAGNGAGQDTIFVNGSLNGVTQMSGPTIVTVTSSATPSLASVSVAPGSQAVAPGQAATYSAVISCHGGSCPNGASYVWTLSLPSGSTTPLGSLSAPTSASTTFVAGSNTGTSTLGVEVQLNGRSAWANATVTVQSAGTGTSGGSQIFGLSFLDLALLLALLVVVVAVVVLALHHRRGGSSPPATMAPEAYAAPPPNYASPEMPPADTAYLPPPPPSSGSWVPPPS